MINLTPFTSFLLVALMLSLPGMAMSASLQEIEKTGGHSTVRPVVDDSLSAGTLTIFVYPPSDPIDYTSPASAFRSIFRTEAKRLFFSSSRLYFSNSYGREVQMKVPYRSTIGHTIACISCQLADGKPYQNWVSFSSLDYTKRALHLLMREQQGLAFLVHHYDDGTLIDGEENHLRLIHYTGKRTSGANEQRQSIHPRYMSFHLTASECAAVKDMIELYLAVSHRQPHPYVSSSEASGQHVLYFSNLIDPYDRYVSQKATRMGILGGGCAPFGVGLMKAGGQHIAVYDTIWKRHFKISENLIGNPEYRMNPIALFMGKPGKNWTHPGFPVRQFDVYDPELIWNFIGIFHQFHSAATSQGEHSEIREQIKLWQDRYQLDIAVGEDILLFSPPDSFDITTRIPLGIAIDYRQKRRAIQGVVISHRRPIPPLKE